MNIEEAKELIYEILDGFCFEKEIDRIMALAYLITPACRGLYGDIRTRTPLFIIKANRERAGKDYLAGVVGILYEGSAIEETPISTGEKGTQTNEELRKKVTANLMQGRRRFHSSNNKGFLNNSVFEGLLTNKTHSDRLLGKNKTLRLDNEMEYSMSANWGLTYTADLWFRCRPINLFFSDEDPNKREFKIEDLHGYVLKNRAKLLSAIITLIKDWFDNGMPFGKTKFTSFPIWAKIVGGIMTYHNLGDPAITVEDDAIGGDKTTEDIKKLVEYMYEHTKKAIHGNRFTSKQIINIVQENQSEWEIFQHLDLNEIPGRSILAKKLVSFSNRYFSNILFRVDKTNKKKNWWYYSFEKKESEFEKEKLDQKENEIIKENILKKTAVDHDVLEEPIIYDEEKEELIHLKCNICGKSPCIKFNNIGKPLCQDCV